MAETSFATALPMQGFVFAASRPFGFPPPHLTQYTHPEPKRKAFCGCGRRLFLSCSLFANQDPGPAAPSLFPHHSPRLDGARAVFNFAPSSALRFGSGPAGPRMQLACNAGVSAPQKVSAHQARARLGCA